MSTKRRIYYWGFLGLIPIIGFISGIVLLYKGIIIYKDKLLIGIGLSSILLTGGYCFGMYYWALNSKEGKRQSYKNTLKIVDELVNYIEQYKDQYGKYPEDLNKLKSVYKRVSITDILKLQKGDENSMLYYKKIKNKYLLFSSGFDNIPFTNDDIYPDWPNSKGKLGFIEK